MAAKRKNQAKPAKGATVRMSEDEWLALKRRALDERRTLGDLIREALRDYLTRPAKKKS